MTLRDELIKVAARCARGERVTKRAAAILLRRAFDRIGELEDCPWCHGLGRTWHSHHGYMTCVECKGSGHR